ncbi:hypothetical protein C8R44DRAFT_981471 [Mycena epipterygia]|nr:hypothetical protein C8R44DRAFT_981471 [Mycena epipterygia]
MSRLPGIYHRLAWHLSLLYVVFWGITLVSYDFRTLGAGVVIPIISAVVTLLLLLKMIPYTTRVDETQPFSRVGKHFVSVGFLMCVWLVPVLLLPFDVFNGSYPPLAQCLSDRYLNRNCISIGANVLLPFAIFGSLISISWTIFHRAVAVHGEADIVLPEGIPHPANFWLRKYPAGSDVPVWMLAHVSDMERDAEPVELV